MRHRNHAGRCGAPIWGRLPVNPANLPPFGLATGDRRLLLCEESVVRSIVVLIVTVAQDAAIGRLAVLTEREEDLPLEAPGAAEDVARPLDMAVA